VAELKALGDVAFGALALCGLFDASVAVMAMLTTRVY
jgi:hypothetical protein